MGFDTNRFENPDSIGDELLCPICNDVLEGFRIRNFILKLILTFFIKNLTTFYQILFESLDMCPSVSTTSAVSRVFLIEREMLLTTEIMLLLVTLKEKRNFLSKDHNFDPN